MNGTSNSTATGLRFQVEDFLYQEAAYLDEWKLNEWGQLFAEDAHYVVPTTDRPNGDPRTDFVFIGDDYDRIQGRITRLQSRHAHREYPYSRTRRYISNVRILADDGKEVQATASFQVWRIRMGQSAPYIGRYDYTLRRDGDSFKIVYRRATLDLEALRDHGTVSIII